MRSCSQKTCSPTFLVRRGRLRKCRPGFFLRSRWRWTRSLHAKLSRSSTGIWLCRWGRLDCFLLVGSQLAASPSWVVGKLSHQGGVLLHHCDSSSVSSTFLTVLKKINDARFCRTLKASQSIFSHRNLSISGWDGGGLGGKPAYGTAIGILTSPDARVRERSGEATYGSAVGIFTSPDVVREG